MPSHRQSVRWIALLSILFGMALWLPADAAARRAAVIVGNANYAIGLLENPLNDARLMSATLRELDFDVLLEEDVSRDEMAELGERMREHLKGADVGLFFYAGHAIEYAGVNYFLPVDVQLAEPAEILGAAFTSVRLVEALAQAGAKINIVILDACRDNPFGTVDPKLRPGLAPIERPITGEILVAYATSAGRVAYDGFSGPNSPYTAALANALAKPGAEIYEIFRGVRREVREATNGLQLPWVSGSLESRFYFQAATEAPPDTEQFTAGELTLDSVLWHFIQDSYDRDDFIAFMAAFPGSSFAEQARTRATTLLASAGAESSGLLLRNQAGSAPPAPQERVLATTGDRSPPLPLRTWPRAMPNTVDGLGRSSNECDALAADPDDPARLAPGVQWGIVNVRLAIRACAIALSGSADEPRLLFQLGRVLDIAERYDWAEHYYRKAADLGYSAAVVNLGYMYRTGRGRERDNATALRLYRQAAALGNPRARTNVGAMYLAGQGVEKSPEEAALWFRLAGAHGWPNAIDNLGNLYRQGQGVDKDESLALELYGAAASVGQTNAMNNLGRAYLEGWGTAPDPELGMEWLKRATEAGNPYAPYHLGRVFLKNASVAADPHQAAELFRLSAERGYAQAHLELGRLYAEGVGLPPDPITAFFHYSLADRQGVKGALEKLAAVRRLLSPAQLEDAQRRVNLWILQNGP